jgi:creatinine amidohydrolase/Fe(II)-dependent formamide hydrolase-like protein
MVVAREGIPSEAAVSAETKANDPLAPLAVIDALEVGRAELTGRRLTSRYSVRRGRQVEQAEMIYRFETDVFTPGDPVTENLAAMLAAQVALNYGLFCREIVFHGPYDRHDRRFLEDMARNTAREIYVKKFLEPNPFLRGDAAKLPVVKQNDYLRARMVFADPEPEAAATRPAAPVWGTDLHRIAILSSGGKDSLLSYGLLNEIGCEVHPIFINESGRHWFTALNAYRHFKKQVPRTARVWTNADRMFAWMLRHLPFVRPDFASVRADEYPIRLWTVAVFLFGALPLLRQAGIGRLLIGDEYDTTDRLSFRGITHYNGLFDQSRYFDNVLTRYFHRKGWRISQFSALRPLSELLILKILAARYPDLQRHQVSCHATHKEGDRVRPCGRCEKCRRIVGMLKALDADPTRCGYTNEQIADCLRDLADRGIHQESDGAEHLLHLLTDKGLLPQAPPGAARSRAQPHILKLRFDKERSPLDTVPTDLREALLRLCLEHADGAVKRSGRLWIDFDPFREADFDKPYPFEKPGGSRPPSADTTAGATVRETFLLGELTWPIAHKRLEEVDTALLPVGAIEQHGPHLPLDTDAFDADYLAREVARRCTDPQPLVLPLLSYGVSYHHEDFSGTMSISPDTLSRLVYEIGMGAARNGVTKLVIVNGHGGNAPALHFAAQMINRDGHIFTCVETGETSDTDIDALIETPNDVHAGELETSTALATRPGLVDLSQATGTVPEFSSRYLNFSSKRSVIWHAYIEKISPNGVLGDPTKAGIEKGRKIWDIMIQRLMEFVEDIKSMSLDEIYQRKY